MENYDLNIHFKNNIPIVEIKIRILCEIIDNFNFFELKGDRIYMKNKTEEEDRSEN